MTRPDRESFDAQAGSQLRGALVFLPGVVFCFAYVFWLLVLTLTVPRYASRQRHALVRRWGKTLLWMIGIRLDERGTERLSAPGPAIVTFNHQSLLDLMLLTSVWPENATVLYKQEFHRVPLFGTVMRRLGMIPVDRSNREAAVRSLTAAGQRLQDEGTKVLIAPEGTRSRTDGLLPFKRGSFHLAVETGMPVLPMVFRGVRQVWPRESIVPRPGVIGVEVLEPIDTTGWAYETISDHIADLRGRYLELVPGCTDGGRPPRQPA